MSECKGLIYKFKLNSFISKDGSIVEKRTARQMKTLSCDGKCKDNTARDSCQAVFAKSSLRQFWADCGELPAIPSSLNDGDLMLLKFSYCEDGVDDMWFEKIKK